MPKVELIKQKYSLVGSNIFSPENREVEELKSEWMRLFKGRYVISFERLIGVRFSIHSFGNEAYKLYDEHGSEITNTNDFFGIKLFFDLKYKEEIKKLRNIFSGVGFTLYAVLVGNELDNRIQYFKEEEEKKILFQDIYLNGNWVNWDDYYEIIVKGLSLPSVPVIFEDNLNQEKLDGLLQIVKGKSTYAEVETPIYGVEIRPLLEDEYNSRRLIAKITNPKFHPVVEVVKKEETLYEKITKTEKINLNEQADIFLESQVDDIEVALWEHLMENKNGQNRGSIFSSIVGIFTETNNKNIDEFCLKHGIDKKRFTKALKKKLPRIIREKLKLQ